jgi:hypothetical protein
MTVAYAALHRTLTYRGEDTGLYVAAFDDGTLFFSRHQPPLYDAAAKRIEPREVLPGSYINVRYREKNHRNWMEAVQLVRLAEDDCPFDPVVPDDGHL